MTTKRKALPKQSPSNPALILSLETATPTISKRKIPLTYKSKKPIFSWWEETLEEHWPLENPPDWDLLSTDQKKIYKLATIGYCLRSMNASKK